jgi:NTE family protein
MRALVLGGGGWKAAYQVGVLRGLLDKNPDLDYDIYTGASAGALNAAVLASGPLKKQLPILEDLWLNKIKGNSSVWNHKLLPRLGLAMLFPFALFGTALVVPSFWLSVLIGVGSVASWYLPYHVLTKTDSIYDISPLKSLISSSISRENLQSSGKKLLVTCVNYKSGKLQVKDNHDENIVDYVSASSAYPVFFPKISGSIDGGVREVVPLKQAIEVGADNVDVILTGPRTLAESNGSSILESIVRTIDIMNNEILINDFNNFDSCSFVKRVFVPQMDQDFSPLDFNAERIRAMYEEGKRAALAGEYSDSILCKGDN